MSDQFNVSGLPEDLKVYIREQADLAALTQGKFLEPILRSHIALRGSQATRNQIKELLAETVAKHLKNDDQWAMEVVLKARFLLPGESVFGERVLHYAREKEAISKQFSLWLTNRIQRVYLAKNKKVCLVVDGGSTLYAVLYELGKRLRELATNHREQASLLSILSINLPGIEAYMSAARGEGQNKDTSDDLLSIVNCDIVGGRLEPRYSAVAVDDPVKKLDEYKKARTDTVFVGLVTGNWIRIDEKNPCAIPLWRDKEQGAFKAGLIKIADECYVVAPLAKCFADKKISEINDILQEVRGKSGYSDSKAGAKAPRRLRLVSTTRAAGALLHDHSIRIQTKLRALSGEAIESTLASPFENVHSMLFAFPEMTGELTKAEQLAWECPHQGTDSVKFRKWAYDLEI